jgi:hypothetical protein
LSGIMCMLATAQTMLPNTFINEFSFIGIVTGFVGADLFATVKTHGTTRPVHVWFRAMELAWLCVMCVMTPLSITTSSNVVAEDEQQHNITSTMLVKFHVVFEIVHVIYRWLLTSSSSIVMRNNNKRNYVGIMIILFGVCVIGRIFTHLLLFVNSENSVTSIFGWVALMVDVLMIVSVVGVYPLLLAQGRKVL